MSTMTTTPTRLCACGCGQPLRPTAPPEARWLSQAHRRAARRNVQPVAGERFAQAAGLPIENPDERKLLLLLAAYEDADPDYHPAVRELAARVGAPHWRAVDELLRGLEGAGRLRVRWSPKGSRQRNRYLLRLDGSPPTG